MRSPRALALMLTLVAVALAVVAGAQAPATQAPAQPPTTKTPDVPYVPTHERIVETMLRMGAVKAGDVVYDLGSGDGRIVITAARKYGARGVGIDIDPERVKEAKENAVKAGVTDKVEFREGDIFDADISPATVVTMYLLPEVNMRLRPKLLRELKPGTRIVSHNYDLGDWKPEKTEKIAVGGTQHVVYSWVVPQRSAVKP